jgi:hypothetical protein
MFRHRLFVTQGRLRRARLWSLRPVLQDIPATPEIGLADYKAGDRLGIYQLELFHLAIELSCFGGRIRSSNSRQLLGCKIGPGEDASVTAL